MFNGLGLEYLYFEEGSNYAIGYEMFEVKKEITKCVLGP